MTKCRLVLSVLGIILINRRLSIKCEKLKDKTQQEWDKRAENFFLNISKKFKDYQISQDANVSIDGYSNQASQDKSRNMHGMNYSSEYHMEKQKDPIFEQENLASSFSFICNRGKTSNCSEIGRFPYLKNKKQIKRELDNWNFTSDSINVPNAFDWKRNYPIERARYTTVTNNGNSFNSVKAATSNSVPLASSINQREKLLHESNFKKSRSSTRSRHSSDQIEETEPSVHYGTGYQKSETTNNRLSTPRLYHPGIFRFELPMSPHKALHVLPKKANQNQNQADAKIISKVRNNSDNPFKEKASHGSKSESNKHNSIIKENDSKFETIPRQVKKAPSAQVNRRTSNFSFPIDINNDGVTYTAASRAVDSDVHPNKMLRETRKNKKPKEDAAFGRKTVGDLNNVSISKNKHVNESTFKTDLNKENVSRTKHNRRRRPLARRMRKRKKMRTNSTTEGVIENNAITASSERTAKEPRYSYSFQAIGPKVSETLKGLKTGVKNRNTKPRKHTNPFSGESELMLNESKAHSISPLAEPETSQFTTHSPNFIRRFPKMRQIIAHDKIVASLDVTDDHRRKSDFTSTSINNNIKVIPKNGVSLTPKPLAVHNTRSNFLLSNQKFHKPVSLNHSFENKIRFSQSKNKSVENRAPLQKYEFSTTRKHFPEQFGNKFDEKNNIQSMHKLSIRLMDATVKEDTNSHLKIPKKSKEKSYDMYLLYSNSHPDLMKEVNTYRRQHNTSTLSTEDSTINSTMKYPSYVLDLYHHLIGSDFLFSNGSEGRNNQPGFKSSNHATIFNTTFSTTNEIRKGAPITTSQINSNRTNNLLTYQQPRRYMPDSLEDNKVKKLDEEVDISYNQNETNFSTTVNYKKSFDVHTANTIQSAVWLDNFSNKTQRWQPFSVVYTPTQHYAIELNNSSKYSNNWHPFPVVRTTTRRYVAVTDI